MNLPTSDRHVLACGDEAQARAFETFAQEHDALDLAAATWAARQRNGLDAQAQAELEAWLAASPAHAQALEDMAATLGQVRQLPADAVAELRRGFQGRAQRPPTPERRNWRARLGLGLHGRPWLAPAAVALLVVAIAGAGWTGVESWRKLPTFEQAFATDRGQQTVVTLPDADANGSTLQLDTATRLQAQLFRDRREVQLQDGQALFSVHSDTKRPFHVRAGNLQITVVGTRFSVRHTASGLDAGRTVVSVEEGHVRVARSNDPTGVQASEPAVELLAGQMVVGDDSGHIGPVAQIPPAAIAPWRAGRVSFDNTPLAQALAEFERYRSTGLVINDPAVADLRVGGSYNVQQFARFVDSLALMLPVRLVPQGEVREIVLRRP
ncbi:FecR domain-containing protein [Pantoea sp. 18069]|uniref:FecR family protein n=1 Tax=Pantoea sp. 18069 TaxID=2681415 RepID=UPI0013592FAD|nr:FecR domain-containing protein [Pantoea sp. 18069]